jgi:hypothetical protein
VVGNAEHNPPMYYFTGGGHVSDSILVKMRGKPPVLFYNDMERDEAARTGLATRPLSEFPMTDLLKEADGNLPLAGALRLQRIFKSLGILAGRIGVYGHVEFSGAFAVLNQFQRLAPDIELVGESGMESVFSRAMETR